jgi:translation initiation factor IF-3
VRLIGPEGNQLGIKPLPEALAMARELELDLVEVADKANPPVCRIMDYGKYRYEAEQKAKESRRKSTNVVVKEMKYRPKIGTGDFDTKTKKVEKFLGEGHKVKVTIMFRGREMQHPELGRKILDHVAQEVAEVGRVEIFPKQDGRNMTMVLAPDRKAQAAAGRKREAAEDDAPSPNGARPAPTATADTAPSESPAAAPADDTATGDGTATA